MQCAAIEFTRNVLNLKDANTVEIDENTKNPVIDLMDEQKNVENMGGTMRLGAYNCKLVHGSKSYDVYQEDVVAERYRHRFEFNNDYRQRFEEAGMKIAGVNPEKDLVEIIELENHPWFVGVQFHPEYKSTVKRPHPLFVGFVGAVVKNRK
jgi:CTP synthase